MKKNIVWLLLLLPLWVLAQTITVKDSSTGQPLELVTITSELPKIYTTTNAKGEALIEAFSGLKKIEFRSLGYKTYIASFEELESQNWQVYLEPGALSLDAIVVAANRWKQNSDNVPSKIISVTPKDVALLNPQTAADLLNISGKVYVQKSQLGGGSPMIRGFATNRLLYTVDGVRMNTAIFRGGNIQNVINLDPFATEKTEVLFGPGSVIYGSDAIGGVMSFQTLTPQLATDDKTLVSGKSVLRYSSANNENTAHADINIGWKKWALVTSLSRWDFDDLRQGRHGPEDYIKPVHVKRINGEDVVINQENELLQIPSAYSQTNVMQKIRFQPKEGLDFQYGFHYSATSSYGRYDRHNRFRNGLPRYAEWNYGPQKWLMNSLKVTYDAQKSFFDEVNIRAAHQFFEESRIDRNLNAEDRNIQVEKVVAYSVNADFVKLLNPKHTLFYGAEWVLNDVNSTGEVFNILTETSQRGPSRYPQAIWQSLAAYVNDAFKASEKVTFQAGLRYNYFKLDADFDTTFFPFPFTEANLSNGSLTGSLGAVYRPSPTWVLSSNFGTAFRSPNVDDIGKVFDSEPGAVTVPNPNLDAEYAYNVDVGAAKIINNNIKIDVSAYYTRLNNALVRRDFTFNGQDSIVYQGELSKVQAIQNAAKARVYGIQAGLEVKLPKGFSFSTDVNFQEGEEELDDGTTSPSRHAAPFFGVSRLSYTTKKLSLQLYSEYQGEVSFDDLAQEERAKDEIYAKDANGNNFAPSWYTLNIKSLYQLHKNISITAGLENITDQRYRGYSSGISAPGRNLVLALRGSF